MDRTVFRMEYPLTMCNFATQGQTFDRNVSQYEAVPDVKFHGRVPFAIIGSPLSHHSSVTFKKLNITMSQLKLTLRSLIGPCVFAVLLMAAGCHKDRTVPDTYWTSISPEADRIVSRLEAGYGGDYDSATYHTLTDSLELLARGNKLPPPILKSQVLYWKAYMYYCEDRDSLQQVYADSCVALTDSASYPYVYARARILQIYNKIPDVPEFQAMAGAINVFKQAKDSVSVAKTYNTMGVRLFLMTNTVEGIKYMKTGRKYTRPLSKMRFKSDFNLFMAYNDAIKHNYTLPDDTKSELYVMADNLLQNPLFSSRPPHIRAGVLRCKYLQTGDVSWLYRIDTVGLSPKGMWLKPVLEGWLTDHFVRKGVPDSARLHFNRIPRNIAYDYANQDDVFAACRDYFRMIKNTDSATYYDDLYKAFVSYSLQETQRYMAIAKSMSDSELTAIEQGFKKKEQGTRTYTWIGSVAILLLCGAGTGLVVRLLRRRHITDTRQLTQELDEVKRRQMMTEVKASDESKTSAPDWEKVESLFVETNPKFIEELYRRYPGLTPGDVRMACFTLMGMETKHIARLLSINPASVAKNRYRLRQKLGLGPDQTLDAFLHSLASTLHD